MYIGGGGRNIVGELTDPKERFPSNTKLLRLWLFFLRVCFETGVIFISNVSSLLDVSTFVDSLSEVFVTFVKWGNSSSASNDGIIGPGIIGTLRKLKEEIDDDEESGNSGDTVSSRHLSNDMIRKDLAESGDKAYSAGFRSVVKRGLGDSLYPIVRSSSMRIFCISLLGSVRLRSTLTRLAEWNDSSSSRLKLRSPADSTNASHPLDDTSVLLRAHFVRVLGIWSIDAGGRHPSVNYSD
eukprot:jgi/Psemu1/286036/fgenesh1_pg.116_\